MVFPISEVIPPIGPIKIVDVGAMSIGDGTEPYAALLQAAQCEVIGFEPVEVELEKLNRMGLPGRTFLPHVIGDGSEQIFYECNAAMTSSLFEPDPEVVDRFQTLGELTRVVSRSPTQTKRLDDLSEVRGTDMLKLDIQGGELMALKGAEQILRGVGLVHTEVEFVPLYKGQPLFAEIDSYLRSLGFLFHRFAGISGRTFKPMIYKSLSASMSQLLWSDAIFVKDFRTLESLAPEKLLKLATILHENYRSLDLAAVALKAYDGQMNTSLHDIYVDRFQQATT